MRKRHIKRKTKCKQRIPFCNASRELKLKEFNTLKNFKESQLRTNPRKISYNVF
jgi:hypothetical protein